jgi:hypothetical protein
VALPGVTFFFRLAEKRSSICRYRYAVRIFLNRTHQIAS